MIKIGILTFHNTTNYGAILQALALEMKLKELGSDCEIINYHCRNVEYREHCKFPKFNKDIIRYAKDIKNYFKFFKKKNLIKKFVSKYMVVSKEEYDKKNISKANTMYDRFVVGSDMVFNLDITNGDLTYYLDFADNGKRYSYAASLGVDKIDPLYYDKCIYNLNKFSFLSVREEQTQNYLNVLLKNKACINCDPTLLFDGTFWEKYEEKPVYVPKKKYILLYFLDDEGIILRNAKKIAIENHYEIIILKKSKIKIKDCTFISNASIGEFLYYIHNAELVITGSYHGMIFSMNYNTNFMYYNRANSSRMESIAKITNSTGRRLTKEFTPENRCDFNDINNAVNKVRKESINSLKNIIYNE